MLIDRIRARYGHSLRDERPHDSHDLTWPERDRIRVPSLAAATAWRPAIRHLVVPGNQLVVPC